MISVRLVYAPAARAMAFCQPGAQVVVLSEMRAARRPAPCARPLPLAAALTAPLSDGCAPPAPRLARADAARGFAEGSFYLPGQIVDRRA